MESHSTFLHCEVATWAVLAQMIAAMALPFFTEDLEGFHIESPTAKSILHVTQCAGGSDRVTMAGKWPHRSL